MESSFDQHIHKIFYLEYDTVLNRNFDIEITFNFALVFSLNGQIDRQIDRS